MNDELFTPQEVADLLKIKKNTVYELIKRKELKCNKIGKQFRISKEQLEDYLNLDHVDMTKPSKDQLNVGINAKNMNSGLNQIVEDKTVEKLEKVTNKHNSEEVSTGSNLDSFHHEKSSMTIRSNKSPLGERTMAQKGIVICGKDMIIDMICNYLENYMDDIPIFRSYMGSYNGLYNLYQGKVHVATAHLWDHITGEYNGEFVKRMLPGTRYKRIHLIYRMQGFYVRKGNPKNIFGFTDLLRSDVKMVNREKGSGTRILLDEYLLKLEIHSDNIIGYENEVTSHLAGASTVARGDADVAMGNQQIGARLHEIEFIPIQKEILDIVVKEDTTKETWYQNLLDILNSKEFREDVNSLYGYDITNMGKVFEA